MEKSRKNVILISCHLGANDDIYKFFNALAKCMREKNNNELIISTPFPKSAIAKYNKNLYFKHVEIGVFFEKFYPSNLDKNPEKIASILSHDQVTNIDNFNIFQDQNWCNRKSNCFTKSYIGMKFFEKKINALLEYLKPTNVLVWGPGNLPSSTLIYQISKKNRIPTSSIEKGWLPETIMIDPDGIAHDSSLKKSYAIQKSIKNHNDINSFKSYKNWYANEKKEFKAKSLKKIAFINSNDDKILKPAITIFGQLDVPTSKKTLNLGAELASIFNNSMHMVEIIEKIFSKEKINIYFKPHPFDAYKFNKIDKSRKVKILTIDSDVHSIIQNSDILIMGDSKLTYEAMLQNKKIINFSNSFLNDLNVVNNVDDEEQLESKIWELLKSKKNTKANNVKLFFDWMLNFYLIPINSKLNFGFSIKDLSRDLFRAGSRNFSGDVDEKKLQKIVDWTFNKEQIMEIIPEIYLNATKDELNATTDELNATTDELNATTDELNATTDELNAIQNQRSYKFLVKLKNNIYLMKFYKLYIYFINKYKKTK